MQTEKTTGRIVTMTMEEIAAFYNSLPRIMNEKFDEKSAYRIGKLQHRIASIVGDANKDRFALFELYGQKDEKGNLSIPQPGTAPERVQDETEEAFNQRFSEYQAIVKNSEEFHKDMAELFKTKNTVEIPPVTFPANFNITPADRMALSALWENEDDAPDAV